jgi:hypothetical protein
MSGETPTPSQPIRYIKLRNRGQFKINLLVEDAARRTVWDGGRRLAQKTEAVIDLSSAPGIQSGSSYRFGAFTRLWHNATNEHLYAVDFDSNLVAVFTCKVYASTKVRFDGYETFE